MIRIFKVDKNRKYFIYGAGGNGISLLSKLENSNYEVIGFIDRRKDIECLKGKKVYNISEL